MERYVVVYKWGESYKNPIILKKDEKVIVDLTREADTSDVFTTDYYSIFYR